MGGEDDGKVVHKEFSLVTVQHQLVLCHPTGNIDARLTERETVSASVLQWPLGSTKGISACRWHKTSHWEDSRRCRAVDVKKMY